MPEAAGEAIEVSVRIDARPEIVFSFFTDPARMVRWKGRSAQLDPRPGGIYRVDINGRDIASGKYVEISPYSRIVYTWGWEAPGSPVPPGSSTIEVSFRPDGAGTIVTLVHKDLPAPARQQHEMGWQHYLARLVKAGAGIDPGTDPFADPRATMGH
ncbi:MAG: SRPBCC domain-containing protein [Chloroflexi bacterium]|nr:SRPBCC domain-containing protein [Chloroflexota bacterium]